MARQSLPRMYKTRYAPLTVAPAPKRNVIVSMILDLLIPVLVTSPLWIPVLLITAFVLANN
jgi:hypothetical protein